MFADRSRVVPQVSAVGAADLDQLRSCSFHDIWQPEGTTDLDQLAPGDDDLALLGVGFEDEKKRGRIVVHHHGAGGAADPGDAVSHRRQTLVRDAPH